MKLEEFIKLLEKSGSAIDDNKERFVEIQSITCVGSHVLTLDDYDLYMFRRNSTVWRMTDFIRYLLLVMLRYPNEVSKISLLTWNVRRRWIVNLVNAVKNGNWERVEYLLKEQLPKSLMQRSKIIQAFATKQKLVQAFLNRAIRLKDLLSKRDKYIETEFFEIAIINNNRIIIVFHADRYNAEEFIAPYLVYINNKKRIFVTIEINDYINNIDELAQILYCLKKRKFYRYEQKWKDRGYIEQRILNYLIRNKELPANIRAMIQNLVLLYGKNFEFE